MTTWRSLTSLIAALAAVGAAQAQTYPLEEKLPAGTHTHVKLSMTLSGELKVQQAGKLLPLKESATAEHEYLERVLDPGANGTAGRTARFYKAAKVSITVAGEKSERALRPERRFLVAHRVKDALLTYSPKGPLTREELQLTEHFDTLAVTGLLPGRAVPVGESWKVENSVAQALCHFEGLTAQELTCKLEQVKDDVASVSVSGTASGVDLGAAVKVTVRSSYRFDLKAGRLTAVDWKQTDEREQGPVSPASAVEIVYTVSRAPIAPDAAPEVGDYALVPVPQGPPPETMTQLAYRDGSGRFQVLHGREWQLAGLSEQHLVLRLMERGEFVAQATLSPWRKTEPGKHLSGEQFKEVIAQTPGWVLEKVLEAEEVKAPANGNWIYRVAAEGETSGVKALQYFDLVAGPQGEQLLVTFTMTPAQAQKLGTRDVALLRGISFGQ
jgi:hypothetical protein